MPRYPQAPYIGPPKGYGHRNNKDARTVKRGIAIHATANTGSDTNEANYATHRTDDTSSHFYVDVDSVTQSLDTSLVAWHSGSERGNDDAISIEITGQIDWSYNRWMQAVDWPELVALVVWLCRTHNITPVRPTLFQMREGWTAGIYTHNDMRLAWGGTTHTDPGPGFPMDHLLTQVQLALGAHPSQSPQEGTDMPQFHIQQLNTGYGPEHATVLTVPPPGAGGAGWGPGWLSFGADFGVAKLRVAVHNGTGWEVSEVLVSNATGRVPWRGGGALPTGAGVVSIVRVPIDPAPAPPNNTAFPPVAALLEYGPR